MTYVVGVVGCGRWGLAHIRTLLELKESGFVKEVYACDTNAQRLEEMPAQIDGCFSSWEEMCDLIEPDLVSLVTPNKTHAQLGKSILLRGLNVLIEKPLATSVADVRELTTLANASRTNLHSGYLLRYHPSVCAAKEIIEEGKIGLLKSIRYIKYTSRNKNPLANPVDGLASHALDMIPYLAGVKPHPFFTNIIALKQNKAAHLSEATECKINAQYTGLKRLNHVAVEISVGWEQNDRSLITIEGSKNALRFDFTSPDVLELGSIEGGFKRVTLADMKKPLEAQYRNILSQSPQSLAHANTHLQTAEILQITVLRAESWSCKHAGN